MPRNGKGQKVQGQRTDLNDPLAKQSAGTGENREYGSRQQDMEAQEAVPMRPPPTMSTEPGGFGPLTRPTERPDQPLTAGAAVGPGPGPEALLLGDAAAMRRRQFQSRMYAEKLARLTKDPALSRILEGR